MTDKCIAIKKGITQESTFGRSSGNDKHDKYDAAIMGGEEASGSGSGNGGTKAAGYPQYTARMPTERYATDYNMNHKNRGLAIIFNHEFYEIPSLTPRSGTNVDCDELDKALKQLNFKVTVYKDCKLRKIIKHIEDAALQDHSDNDCILIAIMSHGEHGYVYAKDVQYKLDSIWHYFTAQNCPTLAGKPKLFFVQACQGDRVDSGIFMQKNTETDSDSSSMSFKIPVYADFLIACSTLPGFYSWRHRTNGSWFIQCLVKELNTNGKNYDILTLLTFVSQHVALDYETSVPDSPMMHQAKQIPCVTTMLTRLLRFNNKNSNTS